MIVLISINVPFLLTFIAIKLTIQKRSRGLQLSSLFMDILLKGMQKYEIYYGVIEHIFCSICSKHAY